MKSIRIVALSCLFAVAAVVSGCSDDTTALLPGISTGTYQPETSGAYIVGEVDTECSWQGCDGDLGNGTTVAGVAGKELDPDDLDDSDAEALFVLLSNAQNLDQWDVKNSDTFNDMVFDIAEEDAQMLTFNASMVTNCNSEGTSGGDTGDATGGTIRETVIVTGEYYFDGLVDGGDETSVGILSFNNCVLEGNLLDVPVVTGEFSATTAIRLNGTVVFNWYEPGTPSMSDPETWSANGTISVATDGDGDGTFNDGGDPEFWTRVVNFNGEGWYEGDSGNIYNGGICAGEAVDFGEDDETYTDDGCADDTDEVNDAFVDASYLGDFEFWD